MHEIVSENLYGIYRFGRGDACLVQQHRKRWLEIWSKVPKPGSDQFTRKRVMGRCYHCVILLVVTHESGLSPQSEGQLTLGEGGGGGLNTKPEIWKTSSYGRATAVCAAVCGGKVFPQYV